MSQTPKEQVMLRDTKYSEWDDAVATIINLMKLCEEFNQVRNQGRPGAWSIDLQDECGLRKPQKLSHLVR